VLIDGLFIIHGACGAKASNVVQGKIVIRE